MRDLACTCERIDTKEEEVLAVATVPPSEQDGRSVQKDEEVQPVYAACRHRRHCACQMRAARRRSMRLAEAFRVPPARRDHPHSALRAPSLNKRSVDRAAALPPTRSGDRARAGNCDTSYPATPAASNPPPSGDQCSHGGRVACPATSARSPTSGPMVNQGG